MNDSARCTQVFKLIRWDGCFLLRRLKFCRYLKINFPNSDSVGKFVDWVAMPSFLNNKSSNRLEYINKLIGDFIESEHEINDGNDPNTEGYSVIWNQMTRDYIAEFLYFYTGKTRLCLVEK